MAQSNTLRTASNISRWAARRCSLVSLGIKRGILNRNSISRSLVSWRPSALKPSPVSSIMTHPFAGHSHCNDAATVVPRQIGPDLPLEELNGQLTVRELGLSGGKANKGPREHNVPPLIAHLNDQLIP